jgi:antitoxin component YwqK of YwqJK toxin-antitoxin module
MKNQLNINGEREGYWENYFPKRNIMSKGHYKNGLRNDYWVYYWNNVELPIG